jgi:hypothetical protein
VEPDDGAVALAGLGDHRGQLPQRLAGLDGGHRVGRAVVGEQLGGAAAANTPDWTRSACSTCAGRPPAIRWATAPTSAV